MKPAPFTYRRAASLDEALTLLTESDDAKILSGGQSLIPLLNMRLARPAVIVDVNGLGGLAGVRQEAGDVVIGALTRHKDLIADPTLREKAPLIPEAARLIGHEAIRARGTIGGSVVHADPSAELPMVLQCLGAELVLASSSGRRTVPVDEFFFGFMITAIQADEMLVEIRLHAQDPMEGSAVAEYARRNGDFAIVEAAARVLLDDGGKVERATLVLGGVGPGPVTASKAAGALVGETSPEVLPDAARLVTEEIEPDEDVHASRGYRQHLAVAMAEEALGLAWKRAQEKRGRRS